MPQKLIGMTWDHPRAYDSLLAASAEYARLHPDIEIVWEKRPLQAFADHPIDDLASQYDLIVIDHPHIGNAVAEGSLVALDGHGFDDQLAKLAKQTVGQSHESYIFEGHPWALAVDTAAQVATYRPDLLDEKEIPRTWDRTIRLAQQGRVLWPIKPVDALMSFMTLAANRGTPCGDGQQLVAEQDGLAVLDAMQALSQNVPDFCLSMNPIQVAQQMIESDQYAYCPLLFGYSNYSREGFRPRLLKFTDIPALGDNGPCGAILGGAGMAVSSRGKAIDVAIDFAFWVCGADCQKGVYFEAGGQPGNAVAWEDAEVNAACNDFFRST